MKKILLIFMATILSVTFPLQSFAASPAEEELTHKFNVEAIMTNTNTGAKLSIPIEYSVNDLDEGNYQSFIEEATVIFKVPYTDILPFASSSSIKETDVKATLTIHYDYTNDKIRVNKVSGSWVPSSSLIYINNREVHYGDGAPYNGGHNDSKYPASNSFSYTTGWPWVTKYPSSTEAFSGARAFSSATVAVSGMTPHIIEVLVKPDI